MPRAPSRVLLRGFQVSRMLRLVADLGIADKLALDGAVAVNDLAIACSVLPEPLIRVLRALASFQIFKVSADGTVSRIRHARACCARIRRTACTTPRVSGPVRFVEGVGYAGRGNDGRHSTRGGVEYGSL